jgi:Cu2+-exporting ATPase
MPASSVDAIATQVADDPFCFHCHARNPRATRWRAVLRGRERAFCCAGCAAVAQTIDGAGLDSFYANRTEPAVRAGESEGSAAEWRRQDEGAHAAGLVHEHDDGRREVALLLDGMTCGACVWLVERWLAQAPGVVRASVNFATRRGVIMWDPRTTSLAALLARIAAIGYQAYPYDAARRDDLARRESRSALSRMAVALLAMMQVMMFALPTYVTIEGIEPVHQRLLDWASFTLTLPVLLYSAAPIFRNAWRDLRIGRPGMDVPVAMGLATAFAASVVSTQSGLGPVYYDSVTMFVALLTAARYLELIARHRAGAAIEAVAHAAPTVAERFSAWPDRIRCEVVAAGALARGDFILVRPGDAIPADGTIVEGRSVVEDAVLTGEVQPQSCGPGSAVRAGSMNRGGPLVVEVLAAGQATRLAAILRLTERAASGRPRIARIADTVASVFVGGLLVGAAATAFLWWQIDPSRALVVTFALLVVSCPCALSLATPAALAASAGALIRKQVVLARPDALEALSWVTHVVFDKTGTLTDGVFRVIDVAVTNRLPRPSAIAIAAALEMWSEHPVARAVRAAASMPSMAATDVVVAAGQGVEGMVHGVRWRIGRPAFVAGLAWRCQAGAHSVADDRDGTQVALGDADGIAAWFTCADAPRPDAGALVVRLTALGLTTLLMSGDSSPQAVRLGKSVGIDDARGDLSPDGKRAAIAELQAGGAIVAMIGDGINDAPAMAQAHVSLSIAKAAPLAQWTSDVVVLGDRLLPIADAFSHARKTLGVIRQNLGWAIAYNAIAIPLAAVGLVTPLAAAAGMSLSSLAVVGNALRVARVDVATKRDAGRWRGAASRAILRA